LRTLDTIENRDAVLNADGTRAEWPKANVVVGNPPFIASREMLTELKTDYTLEIRRLYKDNLTPASDFVSYWFVQALAHAKLHSSLVGLVATDSLPRGDSRIVLDQVVLNLPIFFAVRSILWNDRKQLIARISSKTAKVRVCIVCFGIVSLQPLLDGVAVDRIESDLSKGNKVGFTRRLVQALGENVDVANQGIIPRANLNEKDRKKLGLPKATFLLEFDDAKKMLDRPINPNGKRNSEVIKPFVVGDDILIGRGHKYIVDFTELSEAEASLFEAPFEFLSAVRAHRAAMKQPEALASWWLPWNNRSGLRSKIEHDNYIATPRNAKHRVFVSISKRVVPDCEIVAITKGDNTTLGILSSQFHEKWAMNTCSFYGMGNTPRYSHKSTFETFPFPEGLTPNIPAADYAADLRAQKIAVAAKNLNQLRENWLNPADLVKRVPEVIAGYPDRILPVSEAAAEELKKRTLTKLYNARPAWLDNAHRALDEAVAEAYGWGDDWRAGKLTEDEILARLFKLNQERTKKI
jgi:hypothetical protein